jgi:hypothetical protein
MKSGPVAAVIRNHKNQGSPHMNYPRLQNWIPVMALAALSAASVQAAEISTPNVPVPVYKEPHALNPVQITAIRGISRSVLAAKKSGADNGDDAAQLASLRSTVDALIAADLDAAKDAPITAQGLESNEQRKVREKVVSLRKAARTEASGLVKQLRLRSERKKAVAQDSPEVDTRSAGLPVGGQRARMFEQWAQKLDAALADGNERRTVQLRELRVQLQAKQGGAIEAPYPRGTPTLQAMPADYAPAKSGGRSHGSDKE